MDTGEPASSAWARVTDGRSDEFCVEFSRGLFMVAYGFEHGFAAGLRNGLRCDAVLHLDFLDESLSHSLEFKHGCTLGAQSRVVVQQMQDGPQDADCRADGLEFHGLVTP